MHGTHTSVFGTHQVGAYHPNILEYKNSCDISTFLFEFKLFQHYSYFSRKMPQIYRMVWHFALIIQLWVLISHFP